MKYRQEKILLAARLLMITIILVILVFFYTEWNSLFPIKKISSFLLLTFMLSLTVFIIRQLRPDVPANRKKEKTPDSRDIAERIPDASACKERYRSVIEQASDAIIICTPEWRCIDANASATIMTGYSREELLKMNVLNLVSPDDLEKTPPRTGQLAIGKIITAERKMKRKDDSIYYAESVVQLMPDGKLVSFIRDITGRKNTEQALAESEEKNRTLIEYASDAMMTTDLTGVILDINESFSTQFGYTKKCLVGMNVAVVFDPEKIKEDPFRFDLLLKGETIFRERQAIHKSGNLIEVEIHVKMLPDNRILAIARDITKRKKTEAALKASQEKYVSLVNTIDGIVWEADAQSFRFNFVSKQAERLLGYPTDKWINEPDFWSEHIHPDDRKHAVEYCLKSTLAKEPHEFEYRMIAADGRVVWLRDIVSVIIENDVPVMLRGIMIDITEQKKNELAVQEGEAKFRGLVEQSLVGVYIIQDGKFAYVNPKIAELYGYDQHEITGQPIANLAAKNEMKKVNANISLRLAGEKEQMQYEITGKKKDGSNIQVEVFGSRTLYQGMPAIIGTLIDISARKKAEDALRVSEHKYKLLFESNPLPMWMFSKSDYSILDVNKSAITHYGYTKEEFLMMSLKDLRPVEDIPKFIIGMTRVAEIDNVNLGIWRHKKKDGTIIHVEIIAHDILYQDKMVRLSLAHDVTAKLAAENKLKQSFKEVRQLTMHLQNVREEERKHMAREVHDQLGQQLTVIKMDVSWLNKKLSGADCSVKEKIIEMLGLLDDTVRLVQRIATELRPSQLDHLGLVAAIEAHLNDFEKRTKIKTKIFTDRPEFSLPDEIKTGLFRICQESLTNVVRHANAEQVTISIEKNENMVILKIEDNGAGFDKRKANGKITLGLLGMRERTLMMGGDYQIESEPGKGTVVTVVVPAEIKVQD